MLQAGKVNILIDNCFGSCGKGNVAAYLAERYPNLSVCAYVGGPNSGHQYIDKNGEVQTIKMLPVSGILTKAKIVISPGTIIDVDRLLMEVEKYGVGDRLMIAPTAPIVDDFCRQYERDHLQYISSTFQGTGASLGLKTMRSDKVKLAKDIPALKQWLNWNTSDVIIDAANRGETILSETSQGIHLGIDTCWYPFTTSRQVNVGQTFAYLDVPLSLLGDVVGLARSYWIRVGSVENGYSGDTYPDSHEVTWDDISKKLGRSVLEKTTVTKRTRRVFTFSKIGFELGVRRNGINVCFLTFVDYLNETEKEEMRRYLTSKQFGFDEVYFVSGFGNFDQNIKRVYPADDPEDGD